MSTTGADAASKSERGAEEARVDWELLPDPDNPGWMRLDFLNSSRFDCHALGAILLRAEGERGARVRLYPEVRHSNPLGNVHGGAMLSLIDTALFVGARLALQGAPIRAVTLDISTQFIAPGHVGEPLDANIELMKETGSLLFLRGTLEQGLRLVASFSGCLRKIG